MSQKCKSCKETLKNAKKLIFIFLTPLVIRPGSHKKVAVTWKWLAIRISLLVLYVLSSSLHFEVSVLFLSSDPLASIKHSLASRVE